MTDVFIVGSKGIPAQYGGFETFVEQLTARKCSPDIQYHVSCMAQEEKHFTYNDENCLCQKLHSLQIVLKQALESAEGAEANKYKAIDKKAKRKNEKKLSYEE